MLLMFLVFLADSADVDALGMILLMALVGVFVVVVIAAAGNRKRLRK